MTSHRRARAVPDAARAAGQASAELALVLPMVVLLLLAVVQTALVARDQIVVAHAARAAVREASVDPSGTRARRAAGQILDGAEVEVTKRGSVGEPVEVLVRYVSHTNLPMVGALFPDPTLTARAEMRVER